MKRLTVRYAWQTNLPDGKTYDSPSDARKAVVYPQLMTLLRLYVDRKGRVRHVEEVET